MTRMTHRTSSIALAAILASLSLPAYAQRIPVLFAAGALSPILVLVLCGVLGWLSRSWRSAAVHGALVVAWIALLLLASYFVENDYVIWTPLALYVLHAVLLLALIGAQIARRVAGNRRGS